MPVNKQAYGLYGEYWDLDLVRPTVVLPNSVYLMSLRDLLINFNGLQFYGNIDLWDYDLGSIDYKVGAGALLVQDAKESSVAYFFNNRAYDDTTGKSAFQTYDIKDNFIANMSLQWNTPLDGLLRSIPVLGLMVSQLCVSRTSFSKPSSKLVERITEPTNSLNWA